MSFIEDFCPSVLLTGKAQLSFVFLLHQCPLLHLQRVTKSYIIQNKLRLYFVDVIIECQRKKISVNSKANAKIEYQVKISSKTFKYNLFHQTFKTNLRALQGNMYIGEVTLLYTCGVFFLRIFEITGLRKMVTKFKKVRKSFEKCKD